MIASTHTSLTFRDSIVCMLSRPVAPVWSALAVTHQDLFLLTEQRQLVTYSPQNQRILFWGFPFFFLVS